MPYSNEYLLEAREELKRLEHIIYVSLKYTRTVDVIRNALDRMVDMFDLLIEALLEKAKEEKRLEVLPKSPAFRATKVRELYPDDQRLLKFIDFYAFLKNILKLPSKKREEYRRHVTLLVELENSTAEINIDNLVNCERYVHDCLKHVSELIEGKIIED
ncbi:MAG TPA: hypothetical protein VJH68_05345 [Candidatus Nanoarchaeia archaeon]|nr:hypothetical protein [Candidatus Nanoarchaeia archaeon]